MNYSESSEALQQGQLVKFDVTDLTDGGDGVGRYNGLVVFVPDTVPGDRVLVRLVRVKPKYATGKLIELLQTSVHRVLPSCIVADKCGGCQWQHIDYQYQLTAKRNLLREALARIGGVVEVDNLLSPSVLSSRPLDYRNKATYPLGLSATGQVQAGYYQKGSHKLINLNQCPVQDNELNPLLREIKQDIQSRHWPIYDEKKHSGQVRHLSLRIGRRTGDILLTLVIRGGENNSQEPDNYLPGMREQAQRWLDQYPQLVGVCLNYNFERSNVIFGPQTDLVAGRPYLIEEFGGLEFQLRADTFFQINTEVAERLLSAIERELNLQGNEIVVDAYCGIGTFSLPLARRVRQVIGLEIQPQAVEQAQENARINHLTNVEFYAGAVETLLGQIAVKPDIVLLDPPRQGCDREVLDTLAQIRPQRLVYISCKPATLARDLAILAEIGPYEIKKIQPADFFPQTAHLEVAVFLALK